MHMMLLNSFSLLHSATGSHLRHAPQHPFRRHRILRRQLHRQLLLHHLPHPHRTRVPWHPRLLRRHVKVIPVSSRFRIEHVNMIVSLYSLLFHINYVYME